MTLVSQNKNYLEEYRPVVPSNPHGAQPIGPHGAVGSFDIMGPLLRRKLLIILTTLLGCGAAYMAFTRAVPKYQSVGRLMISRQAPPTADGAQKEQEISIAKHVRLISSQLVLSEAAETGDFQAMKTFEGSEEVLTALVGDVLNFNYSNKSEDGMLEISASGVDAEELPVILNQVINTYMAETAKDSKLSGEEAVLLFAKLRDQLVEEKNKAEESYVKIIRRLNLPSVEHGGTPFNPYLDDLSTAKTSRSAVQATLRDVSTRIDVAQNAVSSADAGQINYLATEAKKFLSVQIETLETIEAKRSNQNQNQRVGQFTNQVFAMERDLQELQAQKLASGRALGSGHPAMAAINRQIGIVSKKLVRAKEDLARAEKASAVRQESDHEILADLEKRNRQWISIYLSTLQAEKKRLTTKLGQLDGDLAAVEAQAKSVSADIQELGILKSRIAEKQKGIDEMLKQLSEINVVNNNFVRTKVRIIDIPRVGKQIAPSLTKFLAMGLLLGGMFGSALAFLIDTSDKSYRSPSEVTEKLNAPVVGRIPPIQISKSRQQENRLLSPALISMHDPTSEAAEAFRSTRASLLTAMRKSNFKSLLITSPLSGDGKSTASSNLAVSFAQSGKSVVLVDADFRRPRLHTYFNKTLKPGVVQVLSGELELADVVQESGQEGLCLLTTGGVPSNAGEVVTSQKFHEILQQLEEKFDYVLVDSPPVLPVADSLVLSSLVDTICMVIRIRKGVVTTSQAASERLKMVDSHLMGVLVNAVDDDPFYQDYGTYGHDYGGYKAISSDGEKIGRLEFTNNAVISGSTSK